MRSYRNAFFVALIGNLVFAGVLAGIWWRPSLPGKDCSPPAARILKSSRRGQFCRSLASAAETPLAPVQLSAERLQSIGVKFGEVERNGAGRNPSNWNRGHRRNTLFLRADAIFRSHREGVCRCDLPIRRKGQPLFTIHSPELVAAEREYLVAKQNAKKLSQSTVPGVAAGIASLLASSRERLEQWNMPEQEIARLESTGEVDENSRSIRRCQATSPNETRSPI